MGRLGGAEGFGEESVAVLLRCPYSGQPQPCLGKLWPWVPFLYDLPKAGCF